MQDILFSSSGIAQKAQRTKPILSRTLTFAGYNKDIVEPYYWHLNFAYYTGKGYFFAKLEDHQFFSENSQFGANIRQMKGGSIRALQENLQQLIQLVKVHLLPLLKEVKEADFYKSWMDEIVVNDENYQQGLNQGRDKNDPEMVNWVNRRDEAISHIKDKWVNEVDGGRMWQMSNSSTERGLDFALLPQLFFGTKLDNPLYHLHNKGQSIQEQLENYTYKVDISTDAITAVARFQYRFYTWLPSAIKETQTTFRIKIASLKQFYSQLQMYMQFMKPLLQEIAKKSEGFEKTSAFHNFEEHNPEFWNMLDYSYSFVRVMGIKKFQSEFGSFDALAFSSHGLYVHGSQVISGVHKGKSAIIFNEDNQHYTAKEFSGTRDEANALNSKQFSQLTTITIDKNHLKKHPCVEFAFSQKRRSDMIETQQGPMQVPYMTNTIQYTGVAWNVFELASYREFLRQDDLKLLENFVQEVSEVKEDLLYYVSLVQGDKEFDSGNTSQETTSKPQKSKKEKMDFSLITLPFQGLGALFSPFIGEIPFPKISKKKSFKQRYDEKEAKEGLEHTQEAAKSNVAEDVWKGYSIFKKSHGFIQY